MGNCQSRICYCGQTSSNTSIKTCASERSTHLDKKSRSSIESARSALSARSSHTSQCSRRSPDKLMERLQSMQSLCEKQQKCCEEIQSISEKAEEAIAEIESRLSINASREDLSKSSASGESNYECHADVEDNTSEHSFRSQLSFWDHFREIVDRLDQGVDGAYDDMMALMRSRGIACQGNQPHRLPFCVTPSRHDDCRTNVEAATDSGRQDSLDHVPAAYSHEGLQCQGGSSHELPISVTPSHHDNCRTSLEAEADSCPQDSLDHVPAAYSQEGLQCQGGPSRELPISVTPSHRDNCRTSVEAAADSCRQDSLDRALATQFPREHHDDYRTTNYSSPNLSPRSLNTVFDPPARHRVPVRNNSVQGSAASSGSEVQKENKRERRFPSPRAIARRLRRYVRRMSTRNSVIENNRFCRRLERACQALHDSLPSRPADHPAQSSSTGNANDDQSHSPNTGNGSQAQSPRNGNDGPVQSTSPRNTLTRGWLSAFRRSPRSSGKVSPLTGKVKTIHVRPYDGNQSKTFCMLQPNLAVDPILTEMPSVDRCSREDAPSSASPSPAASTITSIGSFEFEEEISLSSLASDTINGARPADFGGT